MVDEAHGTGATGPGGRGAVAEAGLEGEIDVVVGTLGKALGSYGAYACCSPVMAEYLINCARSLIFSTALPPTVVAAAMAALELLAEQPRRVEKLQANADTLRDELAREGFDVAGSTTQIVPLVVGDATLAMRICEAALEQGVFAQAIRPPTVPAGTSRLRLTVMASHTRAELREAAQVLGRAAMHAGFRPGTGLPVAASQPPSADSGRCHGRRDPRRLRHRHGHRGRKDVLAACLCAALAADGLRVAVSKPVVSGLDDPADPEWPHDHELLGAAAGVVPDAVSPWRFGPPVSPHLAAELAGVRLERRRASRRRRALPAPVRTCSSSRASAACSSR